MSILKTIRSHEWWEYKLPLLAIYFATAIVEGVSVADVSIRLLCILIFMTVGIVYVSIINDVTDIDEDLACGKSNRMANVKPLFRWLFPSLCVLIELGAIYYIREDILGVTFCALAWISFSLYSIPPVRLKKEAP
ncbi:hypothetical protein [Arcticibacter sp. MXS-1]|uniref:hypothetical protein n=1 Tax=Arcticibacter sp. MXS-1 TaxID=3341726 RepID=UPI0035A93CE1